MAGHEPTGNRFHRPISAARVALGLGLGLLVTSILVLSRPVALMLFSTDGTSLLPGLQHAVDYAQLATGLLGLGLVAAGARSRTLAQRQLPVWTGDLVLLGAAVVVALGLAEGWVRFRGAREWGSATRTPLLMEDMGRGGGRPLLPGVFAQRAVSDFDPRYDRVVLATINRFGLRGALPAVPKPTGRVRVLALGGSTTFGYSVGDGEDWPSRLGSLLGDGHEVINAGRPGATTFRNFAYLRDHLLRLEPDVVVLYEGFNDLWRGVRRHAGDQPDYGIVDEDLPPSAEPLDQGDPAPWPWRLSFLTYRGARWLGPRLVEWRPLWPEPPVGRGPFRFDPAVTAIYERNLGAMVRLCRSHGVRAVIATFAGCDDASQPAEEQRRRMAYVTREIPQLDATSGMEAMELYRDMTRRVARAEGAPLVDLARLMPRDLDGFTDTVHFTPTGERRLAEILARELARAVPPPAGGRS